MSIESMAHVLNHSKAAGTAKVVLLGIANHDGDGGAWPTISTLARYANVHPRGVQRAIESLVASGELKVVPQGGGTLDWRADRRPNRYVITTPKRGGDGVTPQVERGGAGVTNGVALVTERGGAGATQTVQEPSKEGAAAPSRFCSRHPLGADGAACGACRDARVLFEAWAAAQPVPATPRPPRAEEADDCGHGLPTWDRRSCRHCNPKEAAA